MQMMIVTTTRDLMKRWDTMTRFIKGSEPRMDLLRLSGLIVRPSDSTSNSGRNEWTRHPRNCCYSFSY